MSTYYNRKWHQKWWGILLIIFLIVIAIIIIASVLYVFEVTKDIQNGEIQYSETSGEVYNPTKTREGEAKYWLGAQEPDLVIVEWSDYNCPYCKQAFSVLKEVAQTYQNSVKIIHRDFPLISVDSPTLALAARCAGEQGRFWAMSENLFNQQGNFQLTELPTLAQQVGIESEQFLTCMEENRYTDEIRADIADAETLNISAAPTYTVDEYKFDGFMSADQFKLLIEKSLTNLK